MVVQGVAAGVQNLCVCLGRRFCASVVLEKRLPALWVILGDSCGMLQRHNLPNHDFLAMG